MMIHGWQIIGCDFVRPHILEVSQIEKANSFACGQSCQGLCLIFQFQIQLQKVSPPQQRNISITCKKCCAFPPSNSEHLSAPHITLSSKSSGTHVVAEYTWTAHHDTSMCSTRSFTQDRHCRAVLCLLRTYLLVLSEFAVTGPGKFSAQYVCQLRKVWALIQLDSYL